jgi:hypothetical protein
MHQTCRIANRPVHDMDIRPAAPSMATAGVCICHAKSQSKNCALAQLGSAF